MARANEFLRKSESILSYIQEAASNLKPVMPEDVLPVMHQLHHLFPQWVIVVCPIQHPTLYYVSDNCAGTFGYDAQYMMNQMPPQKYFEQIHESDMDHVLSCFNFVDAFLKEEDPITRHQFRFIINYRFRKKDGSYALLHDEKATYRISSDGLFYYSLCKDISSEAVFSGVKVELFKQDKELKKVAEYKPAAAKRLSMRESQLIGLIQKGFTTKEIAHQLAISHNTVRNIRSRMFEKYNVNNS
ncbi:MAG: PAS domain-containing protein, partial [Chitinophagaceae bacterium]|nr:PAS domain-containing protein [Chitinophagaceae bacterium]